MTRVQVAHMILPCGATNEQVIQISRCEGAQATNKTIHQPLKRPWCSLEAKWYNMKFKEPERRAEGSFVTILTGHRYLLVPFRMINRRQVLGSPNLVDDVVNAW